MQYQCEAVTPTNWYYIDSSKIAVCHNRRIRSHKVFKEIASRGKTSVDWFYGFKVHMIINNTGQIVAFRIPPGNVAYNNKELVTSICQNLKGKLFGDKGYVSQELFDKLIANNLELITKLKKNMKPRLMNLNDSSKLKKRGTIESVIDILKTVCKLEHSIHRSPVNAMINMVTALIAYSFIDRKPTASLAIDKNKYKLESAAA